MNFESLREKYVLLDTNVVINYGRYRKFYQSFVDDLFENQALPVISQIVRVELFALADENSRKSVSELIQSLSKGDPSNSLMPFRKEVVEKSIEIGLEYQSVRRKGKSPELGDLLIAGEMKLYQKGENLFLATENHDDFPPDIFARIGIVTIDCIDSIHTIGFYRLK